MSLHEQNFYKLYGNDLPTPPEIVETIQEFNTNLINRFRFDKILPFIDFNHFLLAGGSVLMCFLRNNTQFINSDLDFFLYRTKFQELHHHISMKYTTLISFTINLFLV
ncbi:unnamed protein product [Rotaria magnacalcarata]|nr:unnamed protein product [Rotaria magnacalcarata]